jgi:hypothetical protein
LNWNGTGSKISIKVANGDGVRIETSIYIDIEIRNGIKMELK